MAATALLFPGQGAQSLGMGSNLVNRSKIAADLFSRASEILGYDLLDVCTNGPVERLNATDCCQPALYVHSIATWSTLRQERPEIFEDVRAFAGLSLGEYSALTASGALPFDDGVRLVQIRGQAMQAAANQQPSGMASVLGLDTQQLTQLCDDARLEGEVLQIANLLCPGNTAISGHLKSLDAAEAKSAEAGAMKFIRLAVAGAFHTSLMQSAVEKLRQGIEAAKLADPCAAVYCNVDAQAHAHANEFPELLTQQVVSPVLWEQTLRNLIAAGVEQFYEIGAGRVLAGTLKRIDRKIPCESIGD